MANVLDPEKQQQILALGKLGWTLRRIEQATGIRRETVSRYLKQAGIVVRRPGRWGHPERKAAKEVITDSPADSTAAHEVLAAPESPPPRPVKRHPVLRAKATPSVTRVSPKTQNALSFYR